MEECKRCARCKVWLPVSNFRKKRGRCRPCESVEAIARRAAREAREEESGATVLTFPVPALPEPPAQLVAPPPGVQAAPPPGVASTEFQDALDAYLGALEPPPGPLDALLVTSLRATARRADAIGFGSLNPVAETAASVATMLRLQTALASTRAARQAAGAPVVPVKSKLSSFKQATG